MRRTGGFFHMLFLVMCGAGRDEAEPFQDPARLMRGEVGAIEPRRTRKHLFRREADTPNDYVVLTHRVWQAVEQAPLDIGVVKFEIAA